MPQSRLQYLLDRYKTKTYTPAEKEELAELILTSENDEAINEYLQLSWNATSAGEDMTAEKSSFIINSILQQKQHSEEAVSEKTAPLIHFSYWRRIAAAIIFFAFAGAAYFIFSKKNMKTDTIAVVLTQVKDIPPPQSTKAIITLSNGQTILLDSINAGTLFLQQQVSVTKTADGQIIYTGNTSEIVYNTLTNPRGSKAITLVLADGTRIWLNSESSLTYPIAFSGNQRKVTITGEAYFEVAKDINHPFVVDAKGVLTEVLGTHFNINCYDDEASTNITLLEGSVKISKGIVTGLLKPNQQAQLSAGLKIIDEVNTDEVVAWKEDKFKFGAKADLATIMRQIARWYNVDVEYRGKITGHVGGGISRSVNASQVLQMLEKTGVAKFNIEGNRIIVMP